jgi:hypothetical protein
VVLQQPKPPYLNAAPFTYSTPSLPHTCSYIATQGPLPTTTGEFSQTNSNCLKAPPALTASPTNSLHHAASLHVQVLLTLMLQVPQSCTVSSPLPVPASQQQGQRPERFWTSSQHLQALYSTQWWSQHPLAMTGLAGALLADSA